MRVEGLRVWRFVGLRFLVSRDLGFLSLGFWAFGVSGCRV